jgi:hypothetical protein
MHAALGYQGARPKDWYYAGRDHVFFALEEDLHRGRLRAWALPQYPIRVRERLEGDAKLTLQEVHLLPSSMAAAEARRKRNQ